MVSDGNFVHHVHRTAPISPRLAQPRPALEDGQIWRANDQNFIRMDGKFESTDEVYLDSDGFEEFFDTYPDAYLLLTPDGDLAHES